MFPLRTRVEGKVRVTATAAEPVHIAGTVEAAGTPADPVHVAGTVQAAGTPADPVHIVGIVDLNGADRWSVAQEWQRLDTIAGLVLQTSMAVMIAAAGFYSQTTSAVRHIVLIAGGSACFISCVLVGIALSYRPAKLLELVTTDPDNYKRKRRCTVIALTLLVVAVELARIVQEASRGDAVRRMAM